MGNSSGSYRTTRANSMRAFDKLPRILGQALANAAFSWAPQPILTMWRRDSLKVKKITDLIAKWDREKIAKAYRRRSR